MNASRLAADHIAAGQFDSAARLLLDQVGVINLEPYKELFMSMYARSHVHYPGAPCCRISLFTTFSGIPMAPSLSAWCLRNWREVSGPRQTLPVASITLSDLASRLQSAYQMTTSGNFDGAVNTFRKLLLSVPLLVVDSKQARRREFISISIIRHCRKSPRRRN